MVTVSPCAHQQTHHCTQRDHRFWMKFFLNALVSASAHRIQIWELQFRQRHSCGANATLYDWEWQDMCKWLWTAADYMQWKPRAQRLHQCETLQITYDNAEQMKRANSTSRNMSITRLLQKYNNIIWEDNGPLSMANWGMPSATIHAFTQYLAVLLAFVAICAIFHFVVCNFVCVCCRCVTRPACDSLFLLVWRLSLPRGISSIPAIFASSYVSFSECFFFALLYLLVLWRNLCQSGCCYHSSNSAFTKLKWTHSTF